jgi:hypothetical protein
MSFLTSLFGKQKDTVTVPPGHKVVVVHPAPKAYLGCGESGVWIADLGAASDFADVVSRVAQMSVAGQQASIIWILQPCVLESAAAFDALISTLTAIVAQSRGIVGHCAVVPHATKQHASQMRRLRQSGVGVHYSAEDGACFVEVHKPDGIVVGMPGRAFTE